MTSQQTVTVTVTVTVNGTVNGTVNETVNETVTEEEAIDTMEPNNRQIDRSYLLINSCCC